MSDDTIQRKIFLYKDQHERLSKIKGLNSLSDAVVAAIREFVADPNGIACYSVSGGGERVSCIVDFPADLWDRINSQCFWGVRDIVGEAVDRFLARRNPPRRVLP